VFFNLKIYFILVLKNIFFFTLKYVRFKYSTWPSSYEFNPLCYDKFKVVFSRPQRIIQGVFWDQIDRTRHQRPCAVRLLTFFENGEYKQD
jgi:hypothetical protein